MLAQIHTTVLTVALISLTGCLSGGGDGTGGGGSGGAQGDASISGGGGAGGEVPDLGPIAAQLPGDPVTEMTGDDYVELCETFQPRYERIGIRKWCTLIIVGFAEAQAADPESEAEPVTPAQCTEAVAECTTQEFEVRECSEEVPELLSEGCAEVSMGDYEACQEEAYDTLRRLTNQVSCNRIGQSGLLALGEAGPGGMGPACDRVNRLCPELLDSNQDDSDSAEPRDNSQGEP